MRFPWNYIKHWSSWKLYQYLDPCKLYSTYVMKLHILTVMTIHTWQNTRKLPSDLKGSSCLPDLQIEIFLNVPCLFRRKRPLQRYSYSYDLRINKWCWWQYKMNFRQPSSVVRTENDVQRAIYRLWKITQEYSLGR